MSVARRIALAAIAFGSASSAQAQITRLASEPFQAPTGFGTEAEDDSFMRAGALSNDGVFLVFSSQASNLVPGDTNGDEDVFVRNNSTGALARLGPGREPVISGDGAWIAFTTNLPLVPGDRNNLPDVYVTNRDTIAFQLVSVTPAGDSGNGPSVAPSISANGNRIAFESGATDLGVTDANNATDIYVRDRVASSTLRASLADGGQEPDANCVDPSISGDGLFVAFESAADNMATTPIESATGDVDVFRRDLAGNATEYVSMDEGGAEANGESYDPAISGNGQFVAFESLATNLQATIVDDNGAHDVFRRDMNTTGTVLVSRADASPVEGDASSFGASISSDGNFVAFRSQASNLTGEAGPFSTEAYKRRFVPAATIRIDPVGAMSAAVLAVALSGNASTVAFSGNMSNVPPGETFQGRQDVFVTQLIDATPGNPDTVVKASASPVPVATAANAKSHAPELSSNGDYVVFSSLASNLAIDDTNEQEDVFRYDAVAGVVARVTATGVQLLGRSDQPAVSGNGNEIAFRTTHAGPPMFDPNGPQPDIWVRDVSQTESAYDVVSRVNMGPATGTGGDAGCSEPTISENGRYVAYLCDHTDLVANDTNNVADVFVRDRALGTTVRANVDSSEAQTAGDVGGPRISGNGQFVVFHSDATNLVAGDGNGVHDIFVRDLLNGITERVSVNGEFVQANGTSLNASISFTGRFVAFESVATNLTGDDEGPNRDIFVRDRATGETTRVSVDTRGAASDGNSFRPRISGDGRYVVFESTSSNLGAPAGNHAFVHDRTSGATRRLDNDAAAFGDRSSAEPAISNDGMRYALVSDSTSWTAVLAGYRAGDINVWTGTMPAGTQITVDSDDPDPSLFGDPATVTYTLSSGGIPTGLVTLSADTGESCTVAVGTTQCDLVFPDEGVRTINAFYSGDLLYFPAYSSGETHSVESPGGPGFTGDTPLVTPGGDEGDLAGTSVASSDEFVVLGAPNAEGGEGAVYVFRRDGGAGRVAGAKAIAGLVAAKDLTPVATLTGGALGDKWGSAVAISPDGATIVIGAPDAGGGSGAAFMFSRPGTNWSNDATPDASLVPQGGAGLGDKFGSSVAVGNGNMIAVGAPGATPTGGNGGAGEATVFNGTSPIATLAPAPGTDANANFGQSLAMSGGRLVVGAPNEGAGDNGAVRLYDVTTNSVGSPTTLAPTGGAGIGDKWGTSVAIDGTTIVGGSPGATGGNGAGFVFQDTGGGFSQRGRLDGGADGAGSGAGMAVAVAGDYILLGAPLADIGANTNQGRAFVFVQPDLGWADATALGSLVDANGGNGDGYGTAVALTRRGAIIGIPRSDLGLQQDQGQADSFIVDRIFRGTFE